MKRDLKFERFYPHPVERVWAALTDSKALAGWYMDNDFQPVVGHRFQFRTTPVPEQRFDGFLRGQVLTVEAPYKLAYSFIGGTMERETIVTWTLTAHNGGTLLVLEHTGFTGLHDVAVSHILESGWNTFMANIPAVLDALARGKMSLQQDEGQSNGDHDEGQQSL
ncbi:MAG: SRPBCC domain-containing protein [Chloroflexi bacterium]|nr:SRPBCC domain-containing protein [Chloroflexota bacterium]